MKEPPVKHIILWMLILIPYLAWIPVSYWYKGRVSDINNASFIIINKADMTLSLYNYKGELLQRAGVATGRRAGNKRVTGDLKTPEGVFRVVSIEDASGWTHDFKEDSLGIIKGAYGPYFIRLEVPGQKGIGIHGTHDESSIGGRASEGCIRMKNADLLELVNKVKVSSVVVITPGTADLSTDTRLPGVSLPSKFPFPKNR